MARMLVTGGAGFIGANLAFELEALGHDVVVVDRELAGKEPVLRGFRGLVVEADVTGPLEIPGKFEVVFHQASLTDPRYEDDRQMLEQNVRGFDRVLRLCESHGARLVYASTAGLYGNGPVPMKEDQPKQILTAYAESKLRMDEMAERWATHLPVVGLRYFNVFGPREAHKGRPASMVLHLARQMRRGERPRLFKWGEHRRDFVYVKDVVEANLQAMHAPSGVFNVGTGIGTTFNELVAVLNDVLGTSHPIEYFDMPFAAETYQANTVADVSAAEKLLGFKAHWKLKEAVADYLDWLRAQESKGAAGARRRAKPPEARS